MRAGSGAWQTAGTCATVTYWHLRSVLHCILHCASASARFCGSCHAVWTVLSNSSSMYSKLPVGGGAADTGVPYATHRRRCMQRTTSTAS